MCGIFGYKGPEDASGIIKKGLKTLEYRGYDSWGIALKTGDKVKLKKKVGRISDEKEDEEKAHLGIGHTRWATHGGVTKNNSHPHHDKDNRIFVVHNGIIENYAELNEGMELYSETDTEVIPNLIAQYDDFEEGVRKTVKKLKGSFAFAAIDKRSDRMIAVRNGSPLVIGTGKRGMFVASDVSPFLPYTKDAYFMKDGEIAYIDGKVSFTDFKGKEIRKKSEKVQWSVEQVMKGNYEHFMHKEIHEQPEVIERTLRGQVKDIPKDIRRIVIIGCGTSWHAGLVAEYWIEKLAGVPVEVEYASEFRYRDPVIEKGTTVIAISQSGETADTVAGIKEAKKKGAKIISICNVTGSTIDRISDTTLYTRAGPEIGVASTKAFTTQLTVLMMIAGRIGRGRINKELEKIPDKIREILSKEKEIMELTKEYNSKNNSLFLGRGVNYPIALEGALKLKEISYIHAEGYPAAEMKHGPIALIDKDMPSVFICVKDQSYEKVLSNIQEVKARRGKVIAISTEEDGEIGKYADDVLEVPKTSDELTPFLSVIPLQLIAYHIARDKGCDIDKPRNLAKSVTVE
ncbi:MAG: glutamine--fructose-6-phosphate transaminase (isomerizing) [Nanobdellota archaeon]